MAEHSKPRVAIGMPVFNGAKTVAHAIESITDQTYTNFRLIISDNASTDGTERICEEFVRNDSRIDYIRQKSNIGGEANFDTVLRLSDAEYFMWAAADDVRSPDYVALCVDFLDAHPNYAAATCPTRYTGGNPNAILMGDRSLEADSSFDNIINVFDTLGKLRVNSRFYSIFRRSALTFWPDQQKDYLGSDWALTLQLLQHGKFKRLDSGYIELGREGASKQLDVFSTYRSRLIHWFIPFLQLSRLAWNLVDDGSPAQKLELLKRLTCLNARIAKRQILYEMRMHKKS